MAVLPNAPVSQVGNGKAKFKRPINGLLLLDKPLELSSNTALQVVKRLFCAEKAGHTGSLDPLATGMLPICLGEATKFSQFLLDADKHYRVIAQLGVRTNSGDAEGDVVAERAIPSLSRAQLEAILTEFTGEIMQVPPMFSAIKHQGQPLYKLARRGKTIERASRQISIFKLEIIDLQADRIELDVHCSKGTYIRTLIDDLGERLGCGAHIIALRRLAIAQFQAVQMVTLEQIRAAQAQGLTALDDMLLPIIDLLSNLPEVRLIESVADCIQQGQAVFVPHAPTQGEVRLMSVKHGFLGVGYILDDGRVAPRRLLKH